MRQAGLVARGRRRYRVTTDSAHPWPTAPNALARQFAVPPHQVWAADITALWTAEGWAYLAVVLDIGSRRVVGWSCQRRMTRELVETALAMALHHRPPPRLHHSDRGRQYASHAYRTALAQHGITASMSRAGDCWDNAPMESFFSSLKTELLPETPWPTTDAAVRAVDSYIRFYNTDRLHSALGYISPARFEAALHVA